MNPCPCGNPLEMNAGAYTRSVLYGYTPVCPACVARHNAVGSDTTLLPSGRIVPSDVRILDTLKAEGWNRKKTARILDTDRWVIHHALRRHGLIQTFKKLITPADCTELARTLDCTPFEIYTALDKSGLIKRRRSPKVSSDG